MSETTKPKKLSEEDVYELLNLSAMFIPEDRSNRPKGGLSLEYITIHETDNTDDGADADAHAKYLLGKDARKRQVSWHYTVDSDEAIKHIPLSEKAFHTGTREGNSKSIGIELCVDGGTLKPETMKRGALLAAYLSHEYRIDMANIVQHHYWSKKNCPRQMREKGLWPSFLAQVKEFRESFDF